jgi:hypothetical protein
MVLSFFKGPFEREGCAFEEDGWVTTDPNRSQRIKWRPLGRQTFRWDALENQWAPSNETRREFLAIARQYQSSIRRRK